MNQDLMNAVNTLKNDPAIAEALARGDLRALLNDPKLQSTIQAMQNATPEQEAEALAKTLMDTPSGAKVKSMLEQL